MCQIQAQVKKYKPENCLNCYLQLKLFTGRKLNHGEKFNSKIPVQLKVRMTKRQSTKSPYGEAFLRRNVLTAKCPNNKVLRDKMSCDEKSKNRKIHLNPNSLGVSRLFIKKLPYMSIKKLFFSHCKFFSDRITQ